MDSSYSQKLRAAKQKIGKYCAYQERSHQEVRDKLYTLGLHKTEVESLISDLIQMDYLNEERFAKAFCRGKFLHNKWGRIKIRQALQIKKVSDYCIKKGLMEIEEDRYRETMLELIQKQWKKYSRDTAYVQSNKAARYLIQKGFESNLVWEMINEQRR